ncbi:hypothetical protein PR048_033087 [Dryococelus australis]|uniref:C2H2-type domain-containing protein n=1 Tax=Dryococelus australis TaxID=614101 RepID=A0ABQ9FZ80_9NEOP|nr:hypothetical protein PR048_033087 [Dryococelus australis]
MRMKQCMELCRNEMAEGNGRSLRPAASSGTIPTWENPGRLRLGGKLVIVWPLRNGNYYVVQIVYKGESCKQDCHLVGERAGGNEIVTTYIHLLRSRTLLQYEDGIFVTLTSSTARDLGELLRTLQKQSYYCGNTLSKSCNARWHESSHTKLTIAIAAIRCYPYCGKTFANSSGVKRHEDSNCPFAIAYNTYPCDNCGLVYGNKCALNAYIRNCATRRTSSTQRCFVSNVASDDFNNLDQVLRPEIVDSSRVSFGLSVLHSWARSLCVCSIVRNGKLGASIKIVLSRRHREPFRTD